MESRSHIAKKETPARMNVREDFLELLPKNSVGVEIGVFKGEFTRRILSIVRPKKLHFIDAYWIVYGTQFNWKTPHDQYGELTTWEAFTEAQKVVSAFDRNGVSVFHIGKSVDCLAVFRDEYFDWAYLDSSHLYEDTKSELDLLRTKVCRNGLIAGHDWQDDPNHVHGGVTSAVVEFCNKYNWEVTERDQFLNWAIRPRWIAS